MKNKFIIIMIFIIAFILRFWQLGVNPPSLDWDEASLGYNAYSILKTGRDEYGIFLPLSIRSFNDYKPPLYTYLSILPVKVFGLTEFSTRFISALFGLLGVILTYYLVKEIFKKMSAKYYLLVTFFLSLSPWHLQFSRVAFEANVALTLFIGGVLFFVKGLTKGLYLSLSFFLFGLSMYTYHSTRLVVPFLILGAVIIFYKEMRQKKLWLILSGILLSVIILPIILSFASSTSARFGSVTILNPSERLGQSIKDIEADQDKKDFLGKLMHNRRLVFGREILADYLDHFNFDFLFLTGDFAARHHAVGFGMLYIWELPFILIGAYFLLNTLDKRKVLIVWWFLIAPLASALTKATPHAVRALLYLPTYQIFTALGVLSSIKLVRNKKTTKFGFSAVMVFAFGIFIINFYYYLHQYYIHTPIAHAQDWQYGYKEAVDTVSKIEDKYNKVIVTYKYDQPYIYFLFYQKIDPVWYQNQWTGLEIKRDERNFGKFEFRNIDWSNDVNLKNVLFVATPYEIPEEVGGVVKQIYFPDGSIAFNIIER